MEPKIIYEDEEILGIDKPSGLIVHPDGRNEGPTLSEWIGRHFPPLKEVGEPLRLSNGEVVERPGIVHRIDRETSGVLLVAKTKESFENLKGQFQNHSIQKTYRAFVYGVLKEAEGVIDRPIGKSRRDFRLWSAQRGARGMMRKATTEYRVLDRREGFSYVQVYPKTGRTHQIRVHFKAIHHPVVSDSLYAPNHPPALGFSRLALHAQSVTFRKLNGEILTLESPLPDDFLEAFEIFKTLPVVA